MANFFYIIIGSNVKHSVERYYFLILYFMLRECLAINLLTLLCVSLCFTMLVSMMVLFLNLFAYCFFYFIFILSGPLCFEMKNDSMFLQHTPKNAAEC